MVSRPALARAFPRPLACAFAAVLAAAALARANANYVEAYLPRGVPGFATERGVTVVTRQRPELETGGERVGGFVVQPRLTASTGYDSRLTAKGGGSWILGATPSLSINSDWSQDRVGAALTVEDRRALDQPRQSETNWTATLGGTKTLERGDASLGYGHFSLHERSTDLGAVAADQPIAYRVDDFRAEYTVRLGRYALTPNVDVRAFSFDGASVRGVTVGQGYRDRVILQVGVTGRYALSDQRSLLLVATGLQSRYTHPQRGAPSNNSRSALVLAGLDYLDDGMIRYQLLAGGEVRVFESGVYGTRIAPVVEARAIWSPTGLTTLTGVLSREIEEPAAEGTGGYTATTARLVVDHEWSRDLLLQGRAGVGGAQYLRGGGTQVVGSLGASATWLVNRNLRVDFSYDWSEQGASGNRPASQGANSVTSGAYTRSLALLSAHLGL